MLRLYKTRRIRRVIQNREERQGLYKTRRMRWGGFASLQRGTADAMRNKKDYRREDPRQSRQERQELHETRRVKGERICDNNENVTRNYTKQGGAEGGGSAAIERA